jgi:hypothetical protein
MSVGKAKVIYMGRSGQVTTQNSPDWSFLYEKGLIPNPEFVVGDRVALPDGREFRYAKAGTLGVVPELGAGQLRKSNTNAVAPTQATLGDPGFPSPALVACGKTGSQFVTVTIASSFGHLATGVMTQDELRGGYIVIGNGTSQHPQMRGIIGHPALAAAGALTLHLDAALTADVTVGTTNIEVFMNPYVDVSIGAGDSLCEYSSILGVPTVVATVGQYFWLQTKGPCWVTSAGATCDGAFDRQLFWDKSGLVVSGGDITVDNGYQIAGYAMDASSNGSSNAPLVMLNCM